MVNYRNKNHVSVCNNKTEFSQNAEQIHIRDKSYTKENICSDNSNYFCDFFIESFL